ncbi:hypothetical protein CTEN210_18119 [Chaetoceros tenuissimus]|uniref:Uncharacterized protein n=1 Tax=Chaetoceros tenuissimus TaxID=426638 RepID=A0AAD3DC35_9STRA|nr:hypothetical protein CTEN210_18119 [Chaetoceros tenuissimus]
MLSLGTSYTRYKNYSNKLEGSKRFMSALDYYGDYYYGRGKGYGEYEDVYWASSQYVLTADSFEYQEKGENPTSMANAVEYVIGGDSGDSSYYSIEVEWTPDSGADLRFYAYFYSDDGSTWYSDEARTRLKTGEDWISFEQPKFYISGNVGECFHMDKLDVTNENGDTLTFVNLDLAPFIQSWSNPIDALNCVNGALLTLDVDDTLDVDEIEDQQSAFFDFLKDTDFMKKEQMFRTETGLLLLGLSSSQKEVTFCWIQERTNTGTYTGDVNYSFTKDQCEDILTSAGKVPSDENGTGSTKTLIPFSLHFIFSIMIQSIATNLFGK